MTSKSADGAWRDLGVRAAAAAVLVPVVIGCVWLGGIAFELLLLIASGLMILEWCRMVFPRQERGAQMAVFALGCAVAFGCARAGAAHYAVFVVLAAWAASMLLARFTGSLTLWRCCGVPYLVLPILAMFYLRNEPLLGLVAIIWLLCVVWATDTGAYFAGRLFGGPKLAPRFSPKKTWAGLLGGMLGAGCAAVAVAYFAGLPGLLLVGVLGAVTAAVSQVGDIFESAAKRHFNVKDSGALIPGHGGILDRVDGLLFAAVFVAGVGLVRHGDVERVAHFLM